MPLTRTIKIKRNFMKAYIIETVGFSASTAISMALASNSHNLVTHGTRNFLKRLPIGNKDMELGNFVEEMLSEMQNGMNAIAVHTLYNPSNIRALADNGDFDFVSLMRRDQKAQILSCFYWAMSQFLSGRERFTRTTFELATKHNKTLQHCGLQTNYKNLLILYAINLVLEWNVALRKNSQKTIFMEDFITCPKSTLRELDMSEIFSDDVVISKSNSHKSSLKSVDFLSDVPEAAEKMFENLHFTFGDLTGSYKKIEDFIIR